MNSYRRATYRNYVLFLMFLVYTLTALDRGIIMALIEPIKREMDLTDTQVGLLIGPAYAIFFFIAGIPLGRLADRSSRRALVSSTLFIWSLLTACSGIAQNFMHLVLARIGVSVGKAGGPPAAVALISDIFPAERRAFASAFFYAGASFGVIIAFGAGSWIATHYDWRIAFFAAAAPGLLLAPLIYLTVREPARGMADNLAATAGEKASLRDTFAFMLRQRALLHVYAGATLCMLVGIGGMSFFVSYMVRLQGMSLASAGMTVSIYYGICSAAGIIVFGWLGDRLAKRDVSWRSRMPALTTSVSLIFFTGILLAPNPSTMTIFLTLWALFSTGFVATSYALLQSLVRPQMRATIASAHFIGQAVVAGSVGPFLVGWLSSRFAVEHGAEGLRYALLSLTAFYLWAVAHYAFGVRSVASDLERAKTPLDAEPEAAAKAEVAYP
jgi:MFS family permease